MKITRFKTLSNVSEQVEIDPRVSLRTSLYGIDEEHNIVICNGNFVDFDYIPIETDLILVRAVPGVMSATAAALTVLLVPVVTLTVGAIVNGVTALVDLLNAGKQAQAELEAMKTKMADSIKNVPDLRGASNSIATEKDNPYLIGENLFTPYLLKQGHSVISGTYGETQHLVQVFDAGFNKQIFRSMYCDDVKIKTWAENAPQENVFNFDNDSVFYDPTSIIEIAQDGNNFDTAEFEKKIVEQSLTQSLEKSNADNYTDLYYTLEQYAQSADICILFDGLTAYDSAGKRVTRAVTVIPEYLIPGGAWTAFKFNQNGTMSNVFSRNVTKQMRFIAHVDFNFNAVKDITEPIQVRLRCTTPKYDGTAYDKVYVKFIQSYIYDPNLSVSGFVPEKIARAKERSLSTFIGMKIKATPSNETKLSKINFISTGVARTWNGNEWSSQKVATENPAAWLLEVLTSDSHTPSKVLDSEIDLDSIGDWYEYCEDNNFTVSHVILNGDTKASILNLILNTGNAMLYRDLSGKITCTYDDVRENAIAILNTQNLISFSYEKEMGRRVDGLKITYKNKTAGYVEDTYLVLRPGVAETEGLTYREMNVTGIVTHEHIVKYARRLLAIDELRLKTATATVGKEGIYYQPMQKVLIQHPSLKVGLGSAEIKDVIYNANETLITGVTLYEPIEYDSLDDNGFGVVINCTNTQTVIERAYTAENGDVTEITFTTPIPLTGAFPQNGDTLSYGYLNAGAFNTITSDWLITNIASVSGGYELTLCQYNPAIYETGEITAYIPNPTQPRTSIQETIQPKDETNIEAVNEALSKIDEIVNGETTEDFYPDDITILSAVATMNSIIITWNALGTGIKNTVRKIIVEVNNGTGWKEYDTSGTSFTYNFDRTLDGYPEAGTTGLTDLGNWKIRAKAVNIYGNSSNSYGNGETGISVNTDNYGTWTMTIPAIHAKASGRSVDIQLYKENDFYGDYEFRVQISKDSGSNWNELGDSSLAWTDESSYKGAGVYTALVFEAYRQVLPLTGQASDTPVDTEYWYRVALYHKQTTQVTTYSTPFIVVCKPSSARDLVSGAVKNAQLATGAVTHDKIAARTIQAENLYVTARSKVNTLSNADDGISGWSRGTRFADGSRFGLELVAPNHAVNSNEFTVEPNEIVEVSFGLQLVDPAGATGYYGVHFGCTSGQTVGRYLWSTTTKKWEAVADLLNSHFIEDYRESDILFVKTYILGSNVNIKDVPAPSVSTAQTVHCIQLLTGDTTIRLRAGFHPVPAGYTWRLYQPLAVTIGQSKIVAEQIEVKNLSAINSHLGEINGDSEDYKLVMGSGGSAEEGTFLLGAETDSAYLRRWKENGVWNMAIKLATFIIDAVSSKIKGVFEVQKTDGTPVFKMDPNTGKITAPTPATSTNNTQLATTAFVKNQKYAPNRAEAGSIALGSGATASVYDSTALGSNAEASGLFSTALGVGSNASGTGSIALGLDATATRDYQITIGTKFVYLRFPSNTTEANVYDALSPWLNPTKGSYQGVMGSFGTASLTSLKREKTNSIELGYGPYKTINAGGIYQIGSDLAICTVKY